MDRWKIITTLLCLLLFSLATTISAGQAINNKFVDLDGDGINDHALDANEDGIPDNCAYGFMPIRQDLEAMTLMVPTIKPAIMPVANNLQRFGQRMFLTRSLDKCRSSLATEFSSGLGVGMGSSGGACAGGLCR